MKKLRLLTAIILSLLVVFMIMSCEKDDPIVVDPPVVKVPTCTVNATVVGVGGTVTPTYVKADSGSIISLAMHSDFGYDLDSLIVNGINVVSDIYKSLSTSYYDISLDSNSQVEVVFKKNQLGYLTEGPWTLVKIKDTGELFNWESDFTTGDSIFVHTVTFNSNYQVKSYRLNGNVWWDDSYRLTQDSLFIGNSGYGFKIVELTEEKMVLKTIVPYGDGTTIFEYLTEIQVFEHK